MIATAKQIEAVEPLTCYSADYEQGYMDGVTDGLRASGITDGDAFLRLGWRCFVWLLVGWWDGRWRCYE
jgi:hypothetical protein